MPCSAEKDGVWRIETARDCKRLGETGRDWERLVVAVDRSESATTAAAV